MYVHSSNSILSASNYLEGSIAGDSDDKMSYDCHILYVLVSHNRPSTVPLYTKYEASTKYRYHTIQ